MSRVYFIACPGTMRVKIGYTSGSVYKRLKTLQTGSATELALIAVEPGEPSRERELHEKFAKQRLHGEWFEMNEGLFQYICCLVWLQAKQSMILGEPLERWVRIGLETMNDEIGPLPEDLAALI